MFDSLSERLGGLIRQWRGQARLTEDNVVASLREVRMALLEADVALPVVKAFIDQVREHALGQEVLKSISPGQALIKVVHDQLVEIMGHTQLGLNFNVEPPAVLLMAGLQGAGKTTTAAKLALFLRELKKSVLLVSCDIYRPAAIEQLKTLATQVGAEFFGSSTDQDPVAIAKAALSHAQKKHIDCVIVDTAGRLHIDAAMMDEIKRIHAAVQPIETLFVVDSMTGQDAANTAKAFDEALPLTGVILTKADGDARGGAALSVRYITGKPIKFIGMGEKVVALEVFHPDRMASRILGMGDVLTLVEDAQRNVDKDKATKLAKKLQKGKDFDFEDFRDQMLQMNAMGGIASIMEKIPGLSQLPKAAREQVDDKQTKRTIAMINSMTPQERRFPAIIKGSRKRRIAAGSGTEIQELNRLMKQFLQMQKMMKKIGKGGMKGMMRMMQGKLSGGPGGRPF